MANRYWVGGAGTWNTSSTTNWSTSSGGSSGASVPTASDSVFFDQAGTYTVTCTGALTTLDFTVSAGTVTFAQGTSPTFAISGSISLIAGTAWPATGTLTFNATTTGKTITTNNISISGEVSFDGSGGGWTLASAFRCGNFRMLNGSVTTSASSYSMVIAILYLTGGTLTLNGSTVTANSLSGSATSVSTGTSTLALNEFNATITPVASWYNVTLGSTSASGSRTISNGVTISNTLTILGPGTAGYSRCSIGTGITIGALSTTGTTATRRVYLYGTASVSGSISLTTTGSSCSDVDFYSIAISTNTLTGTRLGDQLNNSGITFTSPKTVYWNLAGSQNWTATGWATSSGGSPNANNFPLPQDTAVFDNAGSITTVTINISFDLALPSIDFSGRTLSMTFDTATTEPNCFGSITLGSGVTIAGSAVISFRNASTKTITSAGKTFPQDLRFEEGSTQLGDALTTSGYINLERGTFNTANYAVTSSSFSSTGSSIRTLTLGTTTWTVTFGGSFGGWVDTGSNLTINAPSSTISFTSSGVKFFQPISGGVYGTIIQAGSGALTIYRTGGGTYTLNNVKATTFPSTVKFSAYTWLVNNFELSGTAGNLVTLSSDSAGSAFTLSKVGGGTVSCNYLSIRDSTATGASALWYAGANSTNVSNNTGWIFTNAPSGGMLFFFN